MKRLCELCAFFVHFVVKKKLPLFLILISLSSFSSYANQPENIFKDKYSLNDSITFFQNSTQPNKKRIHFLDYSIIGMYGVSMSWLYTQWYKGYPESSFHFFNDNDEWLQMDKFGHCWDAYNEAKPLTNCYRWAGYDEKKAILFGAGIAYLFQTTVEVFDGFSSQWGFSWGDAVANTIGAGIFTSQQLIWNEQRIVLKYSFHQTQFSKYRPEELGNSLPENILKDYNGLTYWLTINPHSFFKSSTFPRWLSLAIGFGAEGMTGAVTNPLFADGKTIPSFDRYRQYYLSVDFDLSRIKTKSQILSSVFKLINIVHLPAPAIEFNSGRKTVYSAFYF